MEKIQGYLPKGSFLSAYAVRFITNKDVGGEYSYDEGKEVWFVRFPNTSLGLSTAAKLYCGVIQNGYTIPSDDALRKAVLDHFKVNSFKDLPNEIRYSAIAIMDDKGTETFMFTEKITLPKSIVEVPLKNLAWIAASDGVQISGVSVNKESVNTRYFAIIATYLYIDNDLTSEDAATIAKLNHTSSMFYFVKEYGPTVLELIQGLTTIDY